MQIFKLVPISDMIKTLCFRDVVFKDHFPIKSFMDFVDVLTVCDTTHDMPNAWYYLKWEVCI